MEAVFIERPSSRMASGSAISASAATHSGRYFGYAGNLIRISRCARPATRAGATQHEEHEDIDRGFAGGRCEMDRHAAHDTDQERREHHAPEASKPADHHHDEG